mmetsp:Transcript_15337/g.55216  ORF Transcript_15337/g.55216 Transcript_15337/m.55216 type:complete len:207 (-) Transcript_15337:566-1186(-)
MESTVVLEYSSTTTAPFASSSTPISFRPRSGRSVFGTRPVAHITQSVSITPAASVSTERDPSSFFDIFNGLTPSRTTIPRPSRLFATVCRTSSSNPRSGRSARYMISTSEPKPAKMPANSTAMYPPPITRTRFGCFSNASASSEVIPRSAPGIEGYHALPPGARRIVFALYLVATPSTVVTVTSCGPVTLPTPSNLSTPALSRMRP